MALVKCRYSRVAVFRDWSAPAREASGRRERVEMFIGFDSARALGRDGEQQLATVADERWE